MKKVMLFLTGILAISILGCGGDTEDTVEEDEEDRVPVPIGMVLIPEGPFEMGSNADNANINEQPVHTVYVNAFYMDKREITVSTYRQFVQETGHRAPDWEKVALYSPADDHPIVFVSWHDAMAYAKWAGKRLPTEAEWEKAARGKLVGQTYPWSDIVPRALRGKAKCNFADKNLTHYWWADKDVDDGYAYTAPVGKYPANGYGLYDMAGNVSEWCLDEYDPGFYAISPSTNPVSGETDTVAGISDNFTSVRSPRVLRGGSWLVNALGVRNAVRSVLNPTSTASSVGFRCAKDSDILE
jgi:sulfatase modifying factor 1